MVSYKRTFSRLIPSSLTKKFANNFDVPILAILWRIRVLLEEVK
jgi:hypothetical protein